MRKSRLELRLDREAALARLNEAKAMCAAGFVWNNATGKFITSKHKELHSIGRLAGRLTRSLETAILEEQSKAIPTSYPTKEANYGRSQKSRRLR